MHTFRRLVNFSLVAILALGTAACGRRAQSVMGPPPPDPGPRFTFPAGRDKYEWPYAQTSPFNMAVGSTAQLEPINFQRVGSVNADVDRLIRTGSADPPCEVLVPRAWNMRCAGDTAQGVIIPLPYFLTVPDATASQTPNSCVAVVMPDGNTIRQFNCFARCEAGGPAHAFYRRDMDLDPTPTTLTGDGLRGGHAGSGLPSIGGDITVQDIKSTDEVMFHALKIGIWGKKYFYPDGVPAWPASRVDDNWSTTYGGPNPHLKPGSLLVIPAGVNINTLHLQTAFGRKLFYTLRYYGGYICDDTAWDNVNLCVLDGAPEAFQTKYGFAFNASSGAWYEDCKKIFAQLQVVINNGPDSVGGGGTPGMPLAPPFTN
jgi:hypothetical protein